MSALFKGTRLRVYMHASGTFELKSAHNDSVNMPDTHSRSKKW